jgi:hypothetical protein
MIQSGAIPGEMSCPRQGRIPGGSPGAPFAPFLSTQKGIPELSTADKGGTPIIWHTLKFGDIPVYSDCVHGYLGRIPGQTNIYLLSSEHRRDNLDGRECVLVGYESLVGWVLLALVAPGPVP